MFHMIRKYFSKVLRLRLASNTFLSGWTEKFPLRTHSDCVIFPSSSTSATASRDCQISLKSASVILYFLLSIFQPLMKQILSLAHRKSWYVRQPSLFRSAVGGERERGGIRGRFRAGLSSMYGERDYSGGKIKEALSNERAFEKGKMQI